jgi:hypothetical protein
MKGISAYYLLKKHRLIDPKMPYRNCKLLKEIYQVDTWDDLIRHILALEYYEFIFGHKKLDRVIRIPEVNMQIGGTVTVRGD